MSFLPLIKQIKCPNAPREIQDFKGISELGERLVETSGYLLGNIVTGSGKKNSSEVCERAGVGCVRESERVLGNNYFIKSGKCPSNSEAQCKGSDRYIYVRNITTTPYVKGIIPSTLQDATEALDVTHLYNIVTKPCKNISLPVGNRIYDKRPFGSRQDFESQKTTCIDNCNRTNSEDIAFANCKKDCESGWWVETRCSPNIKYVFETKVPKETFTNSSDFILQKLLLILLLVLICLYILYQV
jgi:hypothetical protein